MKKAIFITLIFSILLTACAPTRTMSRIGTEKELKRAANQYFEYVQNDQFEEIFEMTIPDSEYHKRMSSQIENIKSEKAKGGQIDHEFIVESIEIIGNEGIVTGVDKIKGTTVRRGTEMPIDTSLDFVLKFKWHDGRWMLYTTE
ncbi:MAG: hypothetical protein ACLFSQ_12220 [Candidatus Zixiibacteriota bacterium]